MNKRKPRLMLRFFIAQILIQFVGEKIDSIGSKMLFTLGYHDWKRVRKIISPSFSTIKLKTMITKMCQAIDTLSNHIEDAARREDYIDAKVYFCCLTLDIITSCAFGVKVDSLHDPNNKIVENSNKLFSTNISITSLMAFNCPSLAPIGTRLGFSIFNVNALQFFKDFIKATIDRRLAERDNGLESDKKDLIQLLLDGEILEDDLSNTKRSKIKFN